VSRAVLSALREALGEGVLATHHYRGDETAVIEPAALVGACLMLRDDPALQMKVLMDLTAVDYLPRAPRFEVVYHVYSPALRHRVRLKVPLEDGNGEPPTVESVTPLWASADWYEREVFDLFGINFRGHPNLRRILLYDEFQGHPLRKDYPKERRQPLKRRAPEDGEQ
jgi:NADH-quinone oxidoreductase subunit C